ncbi:MAG: cupin domain-containing protein [Phycisphaeraceae bacterium]|nr:cupin domain-containing protein [Phycisphaeraceae bacterium]MCB9848664.1 cupin domain-containing protein [Phycisphaeraceae bacterium]
MERISIIEKLGLFSEAWSPRVIGECNGQHVKLARLDGEFVWHAHEHEDELFLVVEGEIEIQFRDRVVELREGELCIVPRGVEHRPVARRPASVLLFEPASTVNTGDADDARRIDPQRLGRV